MKKITTKCSGREQKGRTAQAPEQERNREQSKRVSSETQSKEK